MPTLAAKVAPQRTTQYAALASALAEPELRLSPIGPIIDAIRPATFAGQAYLLLDLAAPLAPAQEAALWALGATSEFFWLHEQVGGVAGTFLQPLVAPPGPALPAEMVEARRYRGKTNELFTQVLVNVARWAHLGSPTRLLDPLMGGGTTLFVALRLGLDVVGIEREKGQVEGTATFLDHVLRDSGIRFDRKDERAGGGRRFLFALPRPGVAPQRAILVHGETAAAPTLLDNIPGGARADLLVTDLPYGIQHQSHLRALLDEALPAWHAVAQPEALLALAWDATRLPRATLADWVTACGGWAPVRGGAWEHLAHPVDRVIKSRDVLVARWQPA